MHGTEESHFDHQHTSYICAGADSVWSCRVCQKKSRSLGTNKVLVTHGNKKIIWTKECTKRYCVTIERHFDRHTGSSYIHDTRIKPFWFAYFLCWRTESQPVSRLTALRQQKASAIDTNNIFSFVMRANKKTIRGNVLWSTHRILRCGTGKATLLGTQEVLCAPTESQQKRHDRRRTRRAKALVKLLHLSSKH